MSFDELMKIPVRKFIYKSDESNTVHIGTSAQELQKICPELVNVDEEGILGVEYEKISLLVLSALKDMHNEVERLREIIRQHGIVI